MAKKKSLSKVYIFIIAALTCGAVAGVIYGLILPAVSADQTKTVALSNISAYVKSSDGQNHSLSSDISVQFSGGTSGLKPAELNSQVAAIISDLDYETIAAAHGTEYLQDEIAAALKKIYHTQDIHEVYVTGLVTDASPMDAGSGGNANDPVMEGLFQNID